MIKEYFCTREKMIFTPEELEMNMKLIKGFISQRHKQNIRAFMEYNKCNHVGVFRTKTDMMRENPHYFITADRVAGTWLGDDGSGYNYYLEVYDI